jgi:uncharacterized Zn finger protein (UPF0148 family)
LSTPAVEEQPQQAKYAQKKRITNTADLIRRGAALLQEPCPRCGGLQVRYRGKVYCINEDDIDSIINPPALPLQTTETGSAEKKAGREREPPPIVQAVVAGPAPTRGEASNDASNSEGDSEKASLRRLLREKLAGVSKELEASHDVDQQAKLLELVSKYLETLEKLEKVQP